MAETINTQLTKLLGIKYPVMLAGMNVVAGPELAAAVSNAGGLGSIGGVGYTPRFLRNAIKELKENLAHPDLPFGVDLLLPQVGGNARKTNTDYTGGKLPELIDIIIESGAALFISAVGVPPKWAVDKLHAANIPVMNMVGSTRHVLKAIEVGCDLLCAQGSEGGGHTGEMATTVLLPQVVDLCHGHFSKLTGEPICVVGAGGIFDGRGLAASLAFGAAGVWVGTRFICSEEAGGPPRHKSAVIAASSEDTMKTIIYTGRPLRIIKNDYALDWEQNRRSEMEELTSKGTLPVAYDVQEMHAKNEDIDMISFQPLLCGQAAGGVHEILPAKAIVENMVSDAIAILRKTTHLTAPTPRIAPKTFRQAQAKL